MRLYAGILSLLHITTPRRAYKMEPKDWSKRSKLSRAKYFDAFALLAGKAKAFIQGGNNSSIADDAVALVVNSKPLAVKKKRQQPERETQIKFAVWLAKMGFRYNASAAGGYRDPREGQNFKRMGVSKGFPDIEVPYPITPYHGFYLELKSSSGKLSPEQLEWINYLKKQGYYAEVAYSFEEAKEHFEYYLSLLPSAA